jgi:uncharacterized protein YfaS (alpha-2-macroglobulin family)
VQITLGATPPTCTPANPSISITGPSGSVAPGAQASLTVTVMDNDNSACSSSQFSLGYSVPSGWTASYSSGTLTLSPGGSGSATLYVTAPSGTANGTYTIGVNTYNTSATSYAASASTSESIYTPPPPAQVTVSLGTNQVTYFPGQKVTTSVSVLSGGAPVSGASVTVNLAKPNGAVMALGGTTGSNGVAVVSYTLKHNDPAGLWHDVGSYKGVSASTGFTVQ